MFEERGLFESLLIFWSQFTSLTPSLRVAVQLHASISFVPFGPHAAVALFWEGQIKRECEHRLFGHGWVIGYGVAMITVRSMAMPTPYRLQCSLRITALCRN